MICNDLKQKYEKINLTQKIFSTLLSDIKNTPSGERGEKIKEAQEVKKNLESHIKDLETILLGEKAQELDKFWKDTWKTWNSGIDTSKITFTPQWLKHGEINFKELAETPSDVNEFSKYITNPETAFLNYESLGKPQIFNPNEDQDYQNWLKQEGRENTVNSVMDYVHETFGDTHHLPGIEYQKYLFENQDKIPETLKDGKFHYFPGSAFRYSDGYWSVPLGSWNDGEWRRSGAWAWDDWGSNGRVVLFGK